MKPGLDGLDVVALVLILTAIALLGRAERYLDRRRSK